VNAKRAGRDRGDRDRTLAINQEERMAIIDSPHWNERDGVCTKHLLPMLPCPACLEAGNVDVDVAVRLEEMDWDILAFEKDLRPADLVPPGLGDRIRF